ncbi:unnamed protein product [Malus baccata var. baccata]
MIHDFEVSPVRLCGHGRLEPNWSLNGIAIVPPNFRETTFSATNRLITSNHASVQINVGHLDDHGIYTGQISHVE